MASCSAREREADLFVQSIKTTATPKTSDRLLRYVNGRKMLFNADQIRLDTPAENVARRRAFKLVNRRAAAKQFTRSRHRPRAFMTVGILHISRVARS
jgi:hypothetical protein